MRTFTRIFLPLLWAALVTVAAAETAGRPAPEWTLKDPDGREVSSREFAGRVVVVDFWATWCVPCVEEIPGFIALQKKYRKDGLVVVGISLDRGSPAKVKRFMTEHGMDYTVVVGGAEVAELFGGLEAIPTTFLISRDGKIVHQKTGAWSHEDYEKLVKQHL